MKLLSSEHLFKHTWETVTQALWRKYPNDLNPNVKAIDVINRSVTDDGKLHTTRILGSQWNFPAFITNLLGMPDVCYAVEHSVVDLEAKTMTMKTVNLTFSSVLEVEETIVYKVNSEDRSMTTMSQDAAINITGLAFKDYCEGMLASAFDANASKGRQAVEQVIAKISLENVLDTITEQMQDLCHGLEEAKNTLSVGFDEITSKVTTEFDEIKTRLNDELDGLARFLQSESQSHNFDMNKTTKSSLLLSVSADGGPKLTGAKSSLTAQVIDAGLTAS